MLHIEATKSTEGPIGIRIYDARNDFESIYNSKTLSNYDTSWIVRISVYMKFGLHNIAQTMLRRFNECLSGLDFVFGYIDDICIASSSLIEHKQHINTVFNRLRDYELSINVAKCAL